MEIKKNELFTAITYLLKCSPKKRLDKDLFLFPNVKLKPITLYF